VADRARSNIPVLLLSMLTHHSSSSCMHVSRRGGVFQVSKVRGGSEERWEDFRCGGLFIYFLSCVALHTNRVFDTATAVVDLRGVRFEDGISVYLFGMG
jgi:hypothetical protein